MKTVSRWSAGGVVMREDEDKRIQVALVGRISENLWALPKGTPDYDETIEQTAIREVQEETGLDVELVSSIDATSYSFIRSKHNHRLSDRENPRANVKVNKTVYWYLMKASGGGFQQHDHEYDVACWSDLDAALKKLTYDSEAKIARSAARIYRKLNVAQDALRLPGQLATLRSKRMIDAWNDYVWRTDPELSRLDAAVPLGLAFTDFEHFYREELRKYNPQSLKFAIEDENGIHIGNCMCYDYNEYRQQAEFGIMIGDRNYWGRGYGSDATKTLLAHIFSTTQIRRLYLHTLATNHRALRAFENAGFRGYDHIWREGKSFVQMEALAHEWFLENG
jgi:RimJ/RimL family protein N-acetyltransferase/8-oxo-dGTP pyrophosphatase MutT (NUDIX family)